MKRYYLFLAVFCFCCIMTTTRAFASEMTLKKAVLELQDTEDDGLRKVAQADGLWDGSLIRLKSSLKINESLDIDDYNSMNLRLELPRYEQLGFDCDYQQNSNYDLSTCSLDYNFNPFSGLRSKAAVFSGRKNARIDSRQRYRNAWEKYLLQVNYDKKLWRYDLKYVQTDKRYPRAEYYTSLKRELNQKAACQIGQKAELEFQYRETAADYPHDNSLSRDYYKNEYQLRLKLKSTERTKLEITGRSVIWDKGVAAFFEHYQENRGVIVDYRYKGEKWSGHGRLKYWDYTYSTERTVFDPDDDDDEFEDCKSRHEENLVLGIEKSYGNAMITSEVFVTVKDYRSGEHHERCGIILGYNYFWDQVALRIRLAPNGTASSSKKYYQLRWEYRPVKRLNK